MQRKILQGKFAQVLKHRKGIAWIPRAELNEYLEETNGEREGNNKNCGLVNGEDNCELSEGVD